MRKESLLDKVYALPSWLWWFPLAIFAVGAFLITPYPPMLDWSQHVALGSILARQHESGLGTLGIYCIQPFGAYHVFHQMVRILFGWVGPVWVSRVALFVTFLLYIGSIGIFLRVFKAEKRLLIFAIPLFFGFIYMMGFAPNILAIPFFFFSFAIAEKWRQSPSLLWTFLLVPSLFMVWLIHLLPFYLLLGALGLFFLIACWGNLKHLLAAGICLLIPSGFALWYLTQVAAIYQNMIPPKVDEPSLWKKILLIPQYLMGIAKDMTIEVSLSLLLLAVLALLLWRSRVQEKTFATDRFFFAKVVVVLMVLFAYLIVPHAMMKGYFVHQRFLQIAVLVAFFLIPRIVDRWGKSLLLCGWIISFVFLLNNFVIHDKWKNATKGAFLLASKIPENSLFMTLAPSVKSRLTREPILRRVGLSLQVLRGGVVRPSFTHMKRMPVTDCNPKVQDKLINLNINLKPWLFSPKDHKKHAEYLLIHVSKNKRTNLLVFSWMLRKPKHYKVIGQAGLWLLLKKLDVVASPSKKW